MRAFLSRPGARRVPATDRRSPRTLILASVLLVGLPLLTTGCNWPAYLFSPAHSSDSAGESAINTSTAASLSPAWNVTPPGNLGGEIFSSPTVYDGGVYFGSANGTFYDVNEATGAVVWSHFTTQLAATTCPEPQAGAQGFVSTATIANDPTTGAATVYVAAPDGYLYAWDASTGSLRWRSVIAIPSNTVNDYFNWSSPTVANGKIYVGVASACDDPLVQGGERAYDQATGNLLASFNTTPANDLGGSIWSSAMVASDGSVYVTTGNSNNTGGAPGYSESVVELNPQTLQPEDSFAVPEAQQGTDTDFGGSATAWTADRAGVSTPMVGACNKNGYYYALNPSDLAAGPIWEDMVAQGGPNGECLAAAVWDQGNNRLYLSGAATSINGTQYNGSVEAVDPATGTPVWRTGFPAAVWGTPTLDGAGVLAVGTIGSNGAQNGAYLLNAATGQILATISTADAGVFAQPVFADGYLFVATAGQGLWAYRPSTLTTRVHIPQDGASYSSDSTILAAGASANASRVEFQLSGGSLNDALIASGTSTVWGWLASWDPSSVPDGDYILQSVAFDANGNSSASPPVWFAVDHSPPTTSVALPSAGASLSGSQYLDALASDNLDSLSKVEFVLTGQGLDKSVIAVAGASDIGWLTLWNTTTVPDGTYTLQSEAIDAAGNVGYSAGTTVTVTN